MIVESQDAFSPMCAQVVYRQRPSVPAEFGQGTRPIWMDGIHTEDADTLLNLSCSWPNKYGGGVWRCCAMVSVC